MTMTKEFILQGLNCANCAAKIETDINKMDGVLSSSINFATSKLILNITDGYLRDIQKDVERIVHTHESDVLVIERANPANNGDEKAEHEKAEMRSKIIWLLSGAAAFTVGIGFEWPVYINGNIAFALWTLSYLLLGTKVVIKAVKNIAKGQIFDENFLMAIATIGAFAIGEYAGAAAVMLFYQTGEFLQGLAVRKSKKNIAELMNIRPDYANLLTDEAGLLNILPMPDQSDYGAWQTQKISPESVNIGDIIIVKPGEKIPLDGIVIQGEAMIDTSALTGESRPRKATASDTVLSGCINQNGVLAIQVTQTFGESTASKIIDLVENAAGKKAKVETFITKFAKCYTPVVVGLAVLVATVPPLFFGGEWHDWIYRSLVLLIISCPCALVLSVPLGFFGGIGASSKKGILVKGGNYIEALANLDIVVFDKTGTLTKGAFKVTSIHPSAHVTESELLAYAAQAEVFSSHPIALSILNEYGKPIDKKGLSRYEEIPGHGVRVQANGKMILAGNKELMITHNIVFTDNKDFGTKVYVAADDMFAGCIVISDEIKNDSREAIARLKSLGVRQTVMLTGDTQKVAQAVAGEVGIDEVYAGLLPQHKVEKVEWLVTQKHARKTLAFVGDGINDAPVLAMADVGIAMGGLGSDAAIEAADVVLMTDEPMKLVEAVTTARFTKRIVWQNIIFSLGVQVLFLFLGTMGVASIWEAIFADVGVALIAVLNTLRVLRVP